MQFAQRLRGGIPLPQAGAVNFPFRYLFDLQFRKSYVLDAGIR
jgi:hypothetical protein